MSIPDTPPRIEIEAQVTEYMPNAMTDHFEDNRFAAFDAAILRVLRPESANPQMIIYLPQPTAANGPWHRVGSKVIFKIAPEMLAPGTVTFVGAIHDLRVEEVAGARDREKGQE
jgi:hypothetical protein